MPTEPGYYWYREREFDERERVEVELCLGELWAYRPKHRRWFPIARLLGEWRGPIKPEDAPVVSTKQGDD